MASAKLDLVNQLRILHKKLGAKQTCIEARINKLEDGKTIRDNRRKEILLKEVKIILAKLHETDKRLVRDLKSEVFDHMRSMSKIEREISSLIDLVKVSDSKDMDTMTEAVTEVTKAVDKLGLDDISR